MSKKKQTPKSVPVTKVEKPKAIKWTKSQKALYRDVTTEAQAKANEGAGLILSVYNKILSIHLDEFAVELGIDDDGHDYDVDPNNFRFVRRPPQPKAE